LVRQQPVGGTPPPTPEIATGEGKKARKDGQNLDQMRDFER
jgi:hypothetical protein